MLLMVSDSGLIRVGGFKELWSCCDQASEWIFGREMFAE